MKFAAVLLAAALMALPAAAQERARPDYSRDSLLRLFADEPVEADRAVTFHAGAVEFRALGSDWRFVYAPLLAPLSGSVPKTTREWPDPFQLTGTSLPGPPRIVRPREIERELRGIRARARVRVDANR